jgi:hypothetical protein
MLPSAGPEKGQDVPVGHLLVHKIILGQNNHLFSVFSIINLGDSDSKKDGSPSARDRRCGNFHL